MHSAKIKNANHLPKIVSNKAVGLTLWQQPSSFWTAFPVLPVS